MTERGREEGEGEGGIPAQLSALSAGRETVEQFTFICIDIKNC